MNEKLSFESILKKDNNWILFKELYKNELPDNVIHETEKMLKCCTPECGFATFLCLYCGTYENIPFSCKSKLCSRCGKKYTDIWSQILSEKLLNCEHRHMVMTISDKLWPFFIYNPKLQKILLSTVADNIYKTFSHFANQKITPGFIMVLHPFGDDLKANFHVHIIVTAGGLSKKTNEFINIDYIDYDYIRKTWQYDILTALRKNADIKKNLLEPIIDWCFTYRKNGFVIFADTIILGSKKNILSYIARYTRHPAISSRRIIAYDGKYVTFSYESYGKQHIKKLPKFQFIKAVLLHVASKHFKIIRRQGLYSRRSTKKYLIAKNLLPRLNIINPPEFNWRANRTAFFNHDPLSCPNCGRHLELSAITYFNKFGSKITINIDVLFATNPPPKPERANPHEKKHDRQLYLLQM